MGTRGLFSLLKDNVYYTVYNHSDSYPEGLGDKLIYEIKSVTDWDEYFKLFRQKHRYSEHPSNPEGKWGDIEWHYIIDLNKKLFVCSGGVKDLIYPLDAIPTAWIDPIKCKFCKEGSTEYMTYKCDCVVCASCHESNGWYDQGKEMMCQTCGKDNIGMIFCTQENIN